MTHNQIMRHNLRVSSSHAEVIVLCDLIYARIVLSVPVCRIPLGPGWWSEKIWEVLDIGGSLILDIFLCFYNMNGFIWGEWV